MSAARSPHRVMTDLDAEIHSDPTNRPCVKCPKGEGELSDHEQDSTLAESEQTHSVEQN